MMKTTRTKAEEKFAASQKNFQQAMNEREKAKKAKAEQVVKLKALRLAKEAEDKKAEEEAAAVKAAAKRKKPVRAAKAAAKTPVKTTAEATAKAD